MNQPSKWQLRIHLLLVFLLFLIHHCHRPSSGLFVADAWSQGCPWQLHQVGSGAMAPMVQVMPLWPEAFHTAASLTKVSGVCWINKKTNISADPFFPQQGHYDSMVLLLLFLLLLLLFFLLLLLFFILLLPCFLLLSYSFLLFFFRCTVQFVSLRGRRDCSRARMVR